MRYPIEKRLTNPDIKRLNVIHLHEKMSGWFQLLEKLDYTITPVKSDNNHYHDTAEMIVLVIRDCLKNCSHFIDFNGKYSNEKMCYLLLEKSAKIPLNWLQAILPIVECVII